MFILFNSLVKLIAVKVFLSNRVDAFYFVTAYGTQIDVLYLWEFDITDLC